MYLDARWDKLDTVGNVMSLAKKLFNCHLNSRFFMS